MSILIVGVGTISLVAFKVARALRMDWVSVYASGIALGVPRPFRVWIDGEATTLREENIRVDSKLVRVDSVVLGTRKVWYVPWLTAAEVHVVGKRRHCAVLTGRGIVCIIRCVVRVMYSVIVLSKGCHIMFVKMAIQNQRRPEKTRKNLSVGGVCEAECVRAGWRDVM